MIAATAGADWSNDALGSVARHDAALLGFLAPETFSLSARVRVTSPRSDFDAGALALWVDSDRWAKLCLERSPRGADMVVSVVTDGYSDDCNSAIVESEGAYLRITRRGPSWAFHWSSDGVTWALVRLFRFDVRGDVAVGFLAQSPTGPRCEVCFDDVRYALAAPDHLRDGS